MTLMQVTLPVPTGVRNGSYHMIRFIIIYLDSLTWLVFIQGKSRRRLLAAVLENRETSGCVDSGIGFLPVFFSTHEKTRAFCYVVTCVYMGETSLSSLELALSRSGLIRNAFTATGVVLTIQMVWMCRACRVPTNGWPRTGGNDRRCRFHKDWAWAASDHLWNWFRCI